MTSSPNDEEVASSKKHTQFKIKTRVHKLYPFIRSKLVPYFRPKRLKNHILRVAHTYIAYITEYSPGLKHHCVIFATKAWSQLINIKVILFLIQWLFRYQNPLKISHFFNLHDWWLIDIKVNEQVLAMGICWPLCPYQGLTCAIWRSQISINRVIEVIHKPVENLLHSSFLFSAEAWL